MSPGSRRVRLWALAPVVGVLSLTRVGGAASAATAAQPAAGTDSVVVQATYHGDLPRTGYTNDTSVNTGNVATLGVAWARNAGAVISGQAAVVNGVAYWGDWNGNEHATTSTGKQLWATSLGTTTDQNCDPPSAGIASSATVGTLNGSETVWTGTGDGGVAALNATTGAVIWKHQIAPAVGGFEWSSPAVRSGKLYIGVSSFGDCPLIRGKVVKLDAATGQVLATRYLAPQGCRGDGVWASPAIDSGGNVFITTGNANCSTTLSDAIVRLTPGLKIASSWQIPSSQQIVDSDWGASPTIFSGVVNGTSTELVGSVDKNGIFYAMNANNLSAGPVWEKRIAKAGSCPQCGQGSIAPGAFDGSTLFVAGEAVTIGGQTCAGSVDAVNPGTGAFIWRACLSAGPVFAALTEVPGLILATAGSDLVALNAQSGSQLYDYREPGGGAFYAPATVSAGVVYVGNTDGNLLALSPAA